MQIKISRVFSEPNRWIFDNCFIAHQYIHMYVPDECLEFLVYLISSAFADTLFLCDWRDLRHAFRHRIFVPNDSFALSFLHSPSCLLSIILSALFRCSFVSPRRQAAAQIALMCALGKKRLLCRGVDTFKGDRFFAGQRLDKTALPCLPVW